MNPLRRRTAFAGAPAVALVIAMASGCRDGHTQRTTGEHAGHGGPPAASAPLVASATNHAGHEEHASDSGAPSGYAPVTLDPARASALGIKTIEVAERDFARTVRTVGVVALDDTRTAHVHSKVRGWIDTIHIDFVGRKVKAGEALCSIYSPDVHAAELEFLSVLDRTQSRSAPSGELAQQEQRAQQQLLDAARRRLSLWDVPRSEIERLESTREAKKTFPLLAPRSGTVIDKRALDGMFVDPSVELYTLSDLGRVWALADLYEADVSSVHVGDVARLNVEGVDAPIEAKVTFMSPTVDEATRTLKVRFELANADGKLRPGAFVTVAMDLGSSRALAVPESAVIRTGTRSIVFVAHGEHAEHLQPREIKIGPVIGELYRVDGGLEAGERVATGAQFLLDSESRLRASGGGGGHGGH
jgi:Cu(I)/Ag(I) efflux system membrane fusion protein